MLLGFIRKKDGEYLLCIKGGKNGLFDINRLKYVYVPTSSSGNRKHGQVYIGTSMISFPEELVGKRIKFIVKEV